MKNEEFQTKVFELKARVIWLEEELKKVLIAVHVIEEGEFDAEDQRWRRIGLNADWYNGLAAALLRNDN